MNSYNNQIKVGSFSRKRYVQLRDSLKANNIHTVCIEANCPNRYECFSNGTATFMILGNVCTRNCKYCNVSKGSPINIENELRRVAQFVKTLGLNYVVITSVTRDDLEDGGASKFVECVKAIRQQNPQTKIELLIHDLNGNWEALNTIVDLGVDVLNHNIEVVENLFQEMRPRASCERSLELLKKVKQLNPNQKTKSGLMVGLGETTDEIKQTIDDLRESKCNYLSIGQYLAPSENHAQVLKHYSEEEFEEFQQYALKQGFEHVEAGALVRSSYHAHNYPTIQKSKRAGDFYPHWRQMQLLRWPQTKLF
ncbi:lipoyl synthase [Candidatus Woesearchaeota archaeon]|nr:lipoyl synthase [Candidatus Woesearchaeota archaeon]